MSKKTAKDGRQRSRLLRADLLANPGKGEREMEKAVAALGFPYERQKPIGPWYADFAIPELMLVVEVDGRGHSKEADAARDDGMIKCGGWFTVRVDAEEAKKDAVAALHAVLPEQARVSALRNTYRKYICELLREG